MISAKIPNEVRKGIYRRDGYACALCGDPRHLQIHHVMPRSVGGGNSPYNLISLCRYCHALAHGVWIGDGEIPVPSEEVVQAATEYLADMYAGLHDPFLKLDYSSPLDRHKAFDMLGADEAIIT